MPEIPAIPAALVAPKSSAFTLEEALQQIETFSSPVTKGNVSEECEVFRPSLSIQADEQIVLAGNSPTIQLFQTSEKLRASERHADIGISLKLAQSASTPPNTALSIESIVREVSPTLPVPAPKLNKERRKPLRVISDHIEEPFIVPYTKPEAASEENETKNVALKIVTESIPSLSARSQQHFARTWKKCRQYRRKEKVLHQKRFLLPPVSTVPIAEPLVVSEPKPAVEPTMFQWPEQLDALMQTAESQIRMLSDHLVVQLSQGVKEICFKSVFPGDGCSTILLCAARALTERNYRILLIDAHHRHIDLPKQLNLSGNLDTAKQEIELTTRLSLWVWQESKTIAENMALLSDVLTASRKKYDLILVDDGSVTESPLSEFIAFWDSVKLGGVVLISNMKRSMELPMSHIAKRFRQHHVPLIGIAENYV